QHDYFGDHGAVHGEDALNADAVGNLADGERGADSAAAARDADALKCLQALLVAFANSDADAQRIAGAERRDFLHPLLLGFDERVHWGTRGFFVSRRLTKVVDHNVLCHPKTKV